MKISKMATIFSAISVLALPLNVSAEKISDSFTATGDVNSDSEFNVADVLALQKWLLNDDETTLKNWKAGDFSNDDRLNVFDLCMMKSSLINSIQNRITVANAEELFNALKNAEAGDLIEVESGIYDYTTYQGAGKFDTNAEGTEYAPITLRASDPDNPPVLTGNNTENGYVLHNIWVH